MEKLDMLIVKYEPHNELDMSLLEKMFCPKTYKQIWSEKSEELMIKSCFYGEENEKP